MEDILDEGATWEQLEELLQYLLAEYQIVQENDSELEVEFSMEGIDFRGIIDRLDFDPQKSQYIVNDYKTSKRMIPPKKAQKKTRNFAGKIQLFFRGISRNSKVPKSHLVLRFVTCQWGHWRSSSTHLVRKIG